ncbi:hypothetical protein [Anaeromyxobacter dehalogenans]|uniref:Uncharacterized protein n=1 Tax=Anaeromyxobacter dehalogenans (strain 2CP-C) TaxID=290397 RepID=Q2IQ43_ANADE|nr:hypothetical protein [Anaeromyxobacter dehalogenans]ABC80925.1 hypothetical protein Adeh_1151 [Anaeromyxobacter dehalogenans 2CP-C]
MRGFWLAVGLVAGAALAALTACGSGSSKPKTSDPTPVCDGTCPVAPGCPALPCPAPPPPPPPPVDPPAEVGGFTFYGEAQGLTAEVSDASADEGGNVYVAGGSALFVKRRDDRDFVRVDPAAAGLTANCHDPAEIAVEAPQSPAAVCPIISVAGAAAGAAVVGYRGVGSDYDYDAEWARRSGGADVVAFDGTKVTLRRHVFIASPPGVICEHWDNSNYPQVPWNSVCGETWSDSTWVSGRRGKGRVVHRIVVNHDAGRALSQGDVYLGSSHAVLSILAAHPEQRGWLDYIKGDAAFADSFAVFEHEHPAITGSDGRFLTGESTGLALDPVANVPWFSNEVRTASLPDYATMNRPSWNGWWGSMAPPTPHATFFGGDPADDTYWDNVSGLTFCDDGTLWVASAGKGIARVTIDRAKTVSDPANAFSVQRIDLPAGTGNQASAIACDPSDGSIWVGFGWGGFGRYKDGAWLASGTVPQGAPKMAWNPVRSIQLDRWASPRIVYIAHGPSLKYGPGGVTVYAGP